MRLSIAIPTYNRAECLARTLAGLIPQLSRSTECVVLDNASTDDTPRVTSQAKAETAFLRVVRHPQNIGGNANFLRCFEVSQKQWLWVLPDDDLPHADAVQRISAVVAEHPDAAYVNFATSLLPAVNVCRQKTTTALGLSQYISALDSFSHLLFLTAGVYRREVMLEGMSIAARMTHTYGPHLALLFYALRCHPSLEVIQSHVSIADWRGPAQWNKEELTRGIYHFLALVPDRGDRIRLCKLMEREVPPYLSRRNWVSDLVASAGDADRDALGRAIQRYSTIGALSGRYRTAAIAAILIDGCSPLGSRWFCRLLRQARDAIKRNKPQAAELARAVAAIASERQM